ncbi:unnamed protein product [Ceutorhynchus assimilis]|uniref:UDP-glucuronosyltransferase n=1 Tax=Ceutorhynchus assimilis TaxID=467358 RepID=A0A9N9MH60_9CUCU|nr:unnamed protein product [Ceutorhynchus assimilis]
MLKIPVIVLSVSLLILKQCHAANILVILPYPGLSHFIMFGSLLRELTDREHNLDVVSHFSSMMPIERYNDIPIRGSVPIPTNNVSVQSARNFQGLHWIKELSTTNGVDICKNAFETSQLQNLKNSTTKYDLVITELFGSDCMLGWAWHFGTPSVVLSTSLVLPWASDRFGLPDNPSYIPSYLARSGDTMNIYDRIWNIWCVSMAKIMYYWYSTRPSNLLAKNFFGENMPHLDDLAYNTSLQLINSHFSIHTSRPLVPTVIEVGGLHIPGANAVDEYFNDVLNTNTRGIIYFTMGSQVLTETLPKETIQTMFDAFAELPYKVLWKANRTNLPGKLKYPDNIHFEDWFPQLAILCDPRVKLFISHGGMMGTQEAIFCAVPILGIPLYADQHSNIKKAESMGLALAIDYDDISKKSILEATKKLLNNATYKQNAQKISELFKDRSFTAMDTAIYWIEYVIRNNGTRHLQSASKTLPLYQYYLLDIGAVLVGIPIIVIILFVKLIKFLVGCFKIKKNLKVKTK